MAAPEVTDLPPGYGPQDVASRGPSQPAQAASGSPISSSPDLPPGYGPQDVSAFGKGSVSDTAKQHLAAMGRAPSQPDQTVGRLASTTGKSLWQNLNPVSGIKGLGDILSQPLYKTVGGIGSQVMGGLENAAEQYGENGPAAGAAATVGAVPLVGPQLENARQSYAQGDYTGGTGKLLGLGGALLGPKALGDVPLAPGAGGAAKALFKKSLGIKGIPTAEEAQALSGMERQGIAVGPKAIDKIKATVNAEEDFQQGAIDPTRPLSTDPSMEGLNDEVARTKAEFQDPNASRPIEQLQENLANRAPSGQMPSQEMFDLKKGMHREIRDVEWGKESSPKLEGLKAEQRGFGQSLKNEYPDLGPSLKTEGEMLALKPIMEDAMKRSPGGTGLTGGMAGVFAIEEALRGNFKTAASLAAAKTILHVMRNPAVQSRAAIALSSAGKISIPEAYAKLGAYADTISNATNSQATHLDSQTGKQVYKDPQKGWVDVETGQPVQ